MRHASRPHARRSPHFLLAALGAAVLAACGGGGDSAPADPGTGGTPTPLTVSGVAARGAALAGASVEASCATGSGTATALADGSYSLAITGGVLPCVLKATSSDGATTFHSLAAGSGTTATANITPLTELVIAQMTGEAPAAFYASAAGNAAALTTAVTAEKIDAASTAVIETLQAAGVDTTAITSIVSGNLTAGTGTGYDGVLDTLGTTLSDSGTTLTELVTTVATTSPAAAASAPATGSGGEAVATNLLPAALLLKPKAEHCSALRSTQYRFIVVKPSATTGLTDPVTTLGLGTMDVAAAAGPTWDFGDGSAVLTPVANETCHYTVSGTDGLAGDVVVSPSGLAVGRMTNTWTDGEAAADPAARMVIAMPVQSIAVADLAGDWNALGWIAENGGAASSVDPILVTFASDGKLTLKCDGTAPSDPLSACTSTMGPFAGLSANSAGGFDLLVDDATEPSSGRAFAYRAGNGQATIVLIGADGTLHFMTRQRTLLQPTVGDAHKAWNVQISAARVADALSYNGFEVTATDAASGSFTRTVTVQATGISHAQTLMLNDARDGWVHRAGGSAAGSDGSTVPVREMYSIKLGVGIAAYWLPASNQAGTNARFALSVTQP